MRKPCKINGLKESNIDENIKRYTSTRSDEQRPFVAFIFIKLTVLVIFLFGKFINDWISDIGRATYMCYLFQTI